MKVYLGKPNNWFGPYQLAELLCFWAPKTKDEAIAICDVDNHYCKSWTEEQKINSFFTLEKDHE